MTVRLNGYQFRLRMAVSTDFIFDALLGTDIRGLDSMLKKPKRRQPLRRCRENTHHLYSSSDTEETQDERSSKPGKKGKKRMSQKIRTTPGKSHSEPESSSPGASSEPESSSPEESANQDEPSEPGALSSAEDQPTPEGEHNTDITTEPESTADGSDGDAHWISASGLSGGKERLIEAQEEDQSLRAARRTAGLESSLFFYRNNILYRAGAMTTEGDRIHQVVLPTTYRDQTLRMAHASPLAGHFGSAKTLSRLTRLFFWPALL